MAEVARELVACLPDDDVYAAFVFGLVAWCDADRASDVDVTLCLNRPADYREVTRVRVADVIGRPCPDGPLFADLDRIAWPCRGSRRRSPTVPGTSGWCTRSSCETRTVGSHACGSRSPPPSSRPTAGASARPPDVTSASGMSTRPGGWSTRIVCSQPFMSGSPWRPRRLRCLRRGGR
jgi:hypothetical protein